MEQSFWVEIVRREVEVAASSINITGGTKDLQTRIAYQTCMLKTDVIVSRSLQRMSDDVAHRERLQRVHNKRHLWARVRDEP